MARALDQPVLAERWRDCDGQALRETSKVLRELRQQALDVAETVAHHALQDRGLCRLHRFDSSVLRADTPMSPQSPVHGGPLVTI